MQATQRVAHADPAVAGSSPTFLTLGVGQRLGLVALALAGLWLAIGAVIGWLG